jgi:hypothetical protein
VDSDDDVKVGMTGRDGVVGGAFSLSVACDSWLCEGFWGRGVASGSAGAVDDAGGFGNSLTICAGCQMLPWRPRGTSYFIQAIQNVLKCLGPFCSAMRASTQASIQYFLESTHESSAPSSAAFCRMVSAARDQHGA